MDSDQDHRWGAEKSLLGLEHVADQVDDAVAVAPLVVVPRDELDEVVVQGNPGLGIEDARPKWKQQNDK